MLPAQSSAQTVKLNEMFSNYSFYDLAKVVKFEDNYFAVELSNNRILVFNSEQEVVSQVGGIGQEAGAFYEPVEIRFDSEGNFYVLEEGNERVQWFNKKGLPRGQFRVHPTAVGFAVNSKGEIFAGQPQKGKLISVYARDGRLLRSFGELCTPSSVYGEMYQRYDEWYQIAINRIQLDTDEEDNLYVAFYHAPIIRKYTSSGELVFEKRIHGVEMEKLIDVFWNVPVAKISHQGALSQNIDGIQLLMLIKGIAVGGKTIYLLLGNDSILPLAVKSGTQGVSIQLPRINRGSFYSISAFKEEMLILTTFTFGQGSNCYFIRLPLHIQN